MCGWQVAIDPSLTRATPEHLRDGELTIKCYINKASFIFTFYMHVKCLQRFDAIGWAVGRTRVPENCKN